MQYLGSRLHLALALAAVGCAATTPSATSSGRFPARSTQASPTEANDDALMADGYVNVGLVQVEIEKERCQGTTDNPVCASRESRPPVRAARC